jgi:aspartyl-tRNA(Asn)/glutamyl-tRNA(Gln) amidotransferase subunit C
MAGRVRGAWDGSLEPGRAASLVAAWPPRCYFSGQFSQSPPKPHGRPMSVDRATVRRIAHLARIAISGEEEARLEHELNGILDFVAQLDEIDTSAVEPMTRVAAMTMKKRKDEVTDGFCADDILKNAPKTDDHYFVVPKIIE